MWLGVASASIVAIVVAAAINRPHGAGAEIVAEPRAAAVGAVVGAHEGAARVPTPPDAPMTLADASQSVSIEIYSATWCSACSAAKAWMRQQGISYVEVDVDRRPGAMAQLRMLNPRATLPTFDIDGDVLVGFHADRLAMAITGAAQRAR